MRSIPRAAFEQLDAELAFQLANRTRDCGLGAKQRGTCLTRAASIGNREDLKDFIANISPTDTPFSRTIGKATAEAVYFEWQTDALAAASTANAQLEGDDTSFAAVTPTARLGNRCQISNKSVIVSRTEDKIKGLAPDQVEAVMDDAI